MNELRIHVEQLFEGKVLTGDNIDLKEEIYGNLVARYEDYVASGMSEAEALEKTKASMTNIDDVLEGRADGLEDSVAADRTDTVSEADSAADNAASSAAEDEAAAAEDTEAPAEADAQSVPTEAGSDKTALEAPESATPAAAKTAPAAVRVEETAQLKPIGAPAETSTKAQADNAAAATSPAVAATPDGATGGVEATQAAGASSKIASFLTHNKRWVIPASIVAAVFVVVGIAAAAFDEIFDRDDDERAISRVNASSQVGSSSSGAGDTTAASGANASSGTTSTTTGGMTNSNRGYDIYVDANGNLRYDDELADDLIYAITEHTSADASSYVGTSLTDTSKVQAFVASLPMGEWATSIDGTRGNGVLSYSYASVPAWYDGDSIEAAMAYNATVIFCAMPEVSTIEVMVSESDDPYDYDYYVFERSVAENLYGVTLTSDLVSDTGWTQVKDDNLYTRKFIDIMIERAERS